MSQTNTDYLFQLTAPSVRRESLGIARADDVQPFDDQLARASAAKRDDLGRGSSPTHANHPRSSDVDSGNSDDYQETDRQLTPNETASDPAGNETSSTCDTDCDRSSSDALDDTNGEPRSGTVSDEGDVDPNDETGVSDESDGDEVAADSKTEEQESAEALVVAPAVVQPVAELLIAAAETAPTDSSDVESIIVSAAGGAEDSAISEQQRNWKLVLNANEMYADAAAVTELTGGIVGAAVEIETEAVTTGDVKSKKSNRKTVSGRAEVGGSDSTVEVGSQRRRGTNTSATDDAKVGLVATSATNLKESQNGQKARRAANDGANQSDAQAPKNKPPTVAAAKTWTIQSGSDIANTDTADADKVKATKAAGAKGNTLVSAAGRLQRATGTRRGARSGPANDSPRIDPARFVGRVAKAFQTAHERGGTLQLRLSPPELGSVRLELTVKDGVMSAAVQTETASARRVLLDHLPALRDRLAEQSIRVDRFDVDVRGDENGGRPDWQSPQQQAQNGHSDHAPPRRTPTARHVATNAEQTLPAPANLLVNDHGINVIA